MTQVNKARMLAEFKEIVALPCHSLQERPVFELLKGKLEALGFTVEEDDAGEKLGGNCGNMWAFLPARAQLTADGRRCFDVPFVPRRCGSLRLRLKGRGQLTLRSLTRTSAAAKGGILAHGKCHGTFEDRTAPSEREHGRGGCPRHPQLLIPDAGAITICALQSGRGKYVGIAAHPAEQHPVRKENL